MSSETAVEPISPASRDFRSDTLTTPTLSMLAAMSKSSVGDDIYCEDVTTSDFEHEVATMLGHEAALFVSSGTMGNQIGLRAHLLQPPHSVLCDHRAHIHIYEAGGLASLSQAMVYSAVPSNGLYLTLEDIQANIVLEDDVHYCPTKVISLENTLGGTIMPLSEVKRISAFARANGVKMHLDGARLWNAVAAGAGTLEQYGREFDSISLCFSKGLGAPIGSMLVASPAAFIKRARHIRKSIGGGMRQTGPIVNAARVALIENFPGALAKTHETAKHIEAELKKLGIRTSLPVDTSMLFVDLPAAGINPEWIVAEGAKHSLRLRGGRIVLHHQISDDAVASLLEVFSTVMQKITNGELVGLASKKQTNGSILIAPRTQNEYGSMAHSNSQEPPSH